MCIDPGDDWGAVRVDSRGMALHIIGNGKRVCGVFFTEGTREAFLERTGLRIADPAGSDIDMTFISDSFSNYLKGGIDSLSGLTPVHLVGTPFQRSVWGALSTIPPGQTWSYRDVAKAINNPGAVRAVGRANGENTIPVLVPCHRVINADGTIGGFSAGLDRKLFLLGLEKAL